MILPYRQTIIVYLPSVRSRATPSLPNRGTACLVCGGKKKTLHLVMRFATHRAKVTISENRVGSDTWKE